MTSATIQVEATNCALGELSDGELLRAYVAAGSEEAFAELVRRHLGVVQGVARRHCHDERVAEEVASHVFLTLVNKARGLWGEATLSGWLFTTARFVAQNARAFEQRRRDWATRAAAESAAAQDWTEERERAWEVAGEQIDEAVAELGERDRAAILLRFYEDKSFREIGAVLGVSEEAARKRTDRALEKLRERLKKSGVVYPAAGLVVILSGAHASAATAKTGTVEKIVREVGLQRTPHGHPVWPISASVALFASLALIGSLAIATMSSRTSAPRDVFYQQAVSVLAGDGEGYARTLRFETPAEEAVRPLFVNSVRVRFRVRSALENRFGADAFQRSSFPGMLDLFDTNRIASATVTQRGNRATLRLPWGSELPFVRENTGWKLDFFRLRGAPAAERYATLLRRRNGVFADLAERVEGGAFENIDAAFREARSKY